MNTQLERVKQPHQILHRVDAWLSTNSTSLREEQRRKPEDDHHVDVSARQALIVGHPEQARYLEHARQNCERLAADRAARNVDVCVCEPTGERDILERASGHYGGLAATNPDRRRVDGGTFVP